MFPSCVHLWYIIVFLACVCIMLPGERGYTLNVSSAFRPCCIRFLFTTRPCNPSDHFQHIVHTVYFNTSLAIAHIGRTMSMVQEYREDMSHLFSVFSVDSVVISTLR